MTTSALRAAVLLCAAAVLGSLSLSWDVLDGTELVTGWAIVPLNPVGLAVGAWLVGTAVLLGTAALAGGPVARWTGRLAGVSGLLLLVGAGGDSGLLLAAVACGCAAVACHRYSSQQPVAVGGGAPVGSAQTRKR